MKKLLLILVLLVSGSAIGQQGHVNLGDSIYGNTVRFDRKNYTIVDDALRDTWTDWFWIDSGTVGAAYGTGDYERIIDPIPSSGNTPSGEIWVSFWVRARSFQAAQVRVGDEVFEFGDFTGSAQQFEIYQLQEVASGNRPNADFNAIDNDQVISFWRLGRTAGAPIWGWNGVNGLFGNQ